LLFFKYSIWEKSWILLSFKDKSRIFVRFLKAERSSIWFEFKLIFSNDGNVDSIDMSEIWFPHIFKKRMFFGSLLILFNLLKIKSKVNFLEELFN
jgi:hypothetical protein